LCFQGANQKVKLRVLQHFFFSTPEPYFDLISDFSQMTSNL